MKTFGLGFYLKKEQIRKDGTAPIYARITIDRKRAEFAIKRYVNPQMNGMRIQEKHQVDGQKYGS